MTRTNQPTQAADVIEYVDAISSLLARYVEIHNEVFLPWWRAIPLPFLYKRVDFGSLHERSVCVLVELERFHNQLSHRFGDERSDHEAPASCLYLYVQVLLQTVLLLVDITQGLAQKSEGLPAFGLQSYRRLVRHYEDSVSDYVAIGKELNALFYRNQSPF